MDPRNDPDLESRERRLGGPLFLRMDTPSPENRERGRHLNWVHREDLPHVFTTLVVNHGDAQATVH